MTISERIFELLDKRGMSQKEFSEKTGIAQSSISDWKKKTNAGTVYQRGQTTVNLGTLYSEEEKLA